MTLRSLFSAEEGNYQDHLTPDRIGLAFGLCLASGFATAVGSMTPFLVKVANSKFMAFALGVSSGVMIYVSFVELFAGESVDEFENAGYTDVLAYRYSTLAFFGGLFFMWLLDKIVHLLTNREALRLLNPFAQDMSFREGYPSHAQDTSGKDLEANKVAVAAEELACPSKDKAQHTGDECSACSHGPEAHALHDQEHSKANRPKWCQACARYTSRVLTAFDSNDLDLHSDGMTAAEHAAVEQQMKDPYANLGKAGLMTALAIGIHNVPEGLATFMATLASIKSGGAMAVAIAIHNIPEGIAVSMPYYYATGSRYKALLYGTLAGFPLPVGGLIAYGIVSSDAEASSLMFGLLFSLAAGMMVAVVFMEILPNAYLFDPRNIWVGRGVALGFAIMAASLLLFGVGE
eukprot:CAMPEP_0202393518 /NCGR_PEP_ID=MMETSP1127-20130417/92947_1 /ASSEMBLY_ACC=CAM_ASM_000462 /TAXON_ID=3047 /ORGANISM="Dunaliella tertiolecta, Strain CCMP1320" /LENGTH=403 /DNA_ID=CAMNT_0048996097 /DNA_START=51 /DNA_END=1262 /DNA_ORIENTATION=-